MACFLTASFESSARIKFINNILTSVRVVCMNTQVLGHIPLFHTPHSMFTELGAGGNFEVNVICLTREMLR